MKLPLLVLLAGIAVTRLSFGAEADPVETPRSSPSLVQITDDSKLPRVLLIGDSISMGYTLPVRANLIGVANVHRPPTNCGSTRSGVENLDKWLGTGRWDVIHFNWGMHDLKYLENGKQNVPISDYERNLRDLVARLHKTGATLIFATTTPLPHDTSGKFKRTANAEVVYNEMAVNVMKENGVMIDDLHALAAPQTDKILSKDGVHYNSDGYKILARQVSDTIAKALSERTKAPAPQSK